VVFCFFSMIYFAINHYVLVLSVPFAILVSCFLLHPFDRKNAVDKTIAFLRKYTVLFIFTVGFLAYIFLFVFLAGGHKAWIIVFLTAIIIFIRGIIKSTKPITAPLSLGLLLLFVFAQSSLLDKAGITSHAILQRFASTINEEVRQDSGNSYSIGVGSHDIHEKEFQVYFKDRVIKAASSDAEDTRMKLLQLFSKDTKVYCLLTEKDYEQFIQNAFQGRVHIIQEDYIVRRRMSIDKGFFMALLKLDQAVVRDYFKEKLVLLKKENDG